MPAKLTSFTIFALSDEALYTLTFTELPRQLSTERLLLEYVCVRGGAGCGGDGDGDGERTIVTKHLPDWI
jgi:hypothetical protein